MFTKQDLQKLLVLLSRQAKKDSEFESTNTVGANAEIPMIRDGKNLRIPFDKLRDAIAGSFAIPDEAITIDHELDENSENVIQNQAVAKEFKKYTKTEDLADVATSGQYSDLNGTPTKESGVSGQGWVPGCVIAAALAGKADIDTDTQKLAYNSMPDVVFTVATTTENLQDGFYYVPPVDGDGGYFLFVDDGESVTISPVGGLVYYNSSTGNDSYPQGFYTWNGTGMVLASAAGSGSGQVSFQVIDSLLNTSTTDALSAGGGLALLKKTLTVINHIVSSSDQASYSPDAGDLVFIPSTNKLRYYYDMSSEYGGNTDPSSDPITLNALASYIEFDPDHKVLYTKPDSSLCRWVNGTWQAVNDISNKADKSEMAIESVSGDQTKKKITLKQGTYADVVTEHQSLSNYPTKTEMNTAIQQSAGQDGKSAYQVAVDNGFIGSEAQWLASLKGNDGVASGDEVVVVNNFDGEPDNLEEGQKAVLGAGLGTSIGKVFNVNTNDPNNSEPYSLWVGTAEQLAQIEENDDFDENTIYLVGTIPTPAVKYNVTFNGTNCSSDVSIGQKVKENAALVVEITPDTNHTIDTISVVMGSTTLNAGTDYTMTDGSGGKKTITIAEVTAAVSISASASVHINSLTLNASAQDGNIIGLSAAVTPNALTGVTYTWSIPANTTKFSISGSGNTAAVSLLNGAQIDDSVVVTCIATNSEVTSTVTQTITVTATADYVNNVPITALGTVSYLAGTAANTYQFSVAKTPADGNNPSIVWSVASTPNGVSTINSSTGLLTITDDCNVVVTATADSFTSSSESIHLTYALSGPMPFEDEVMHKAMNSLVMGNENTPVTYEAAEVYENSNLSYLYTDGSSLQVIKVAAPNAEYFDEYKYFKAARNLNLQSWPKLRSVTLPHGYEIGTSKHTFSYLPKLRELKCDYDAGSAVTGITALPNASINNCSKLTKIVLPDSLTTLYSSSAGGSIYSCPNLQVLDLSNTQITGLPGSDRIFQSCGKLKTIIFPDTFVAGWSGSARPFVNNTKLVNFVFKENVLNAMKFTKDQNEGRLNLIFTATGNEGDEIPVGWNITDGYGNALAITVYVYVPDDSFNDYVNKSPYSTYNTNGRLKKHSDLRTEDPYWDKTVYSVTTDAEIGNSNTDTDVEYGSSYTAVLTPSAGVNLVITMDGDDVMADCYDSTTNTLSIPYVIGDIVISNQVNQGEVS